MRASSPLAGSPWPHEMVIRVQEDAHHVLELLWIREAWGLEPRGADLPPPLVDPPARVEGVAEPVWTTAWPVLWDAVVEHEAAAADLAGAYLAAEPDAPDQLALLRATVGRGWRELVGDAALPAAFAEWDRARFDARTRRPQPAFDDQPERRCLAALVPAWRRGLTTVVPIPCAGEHTRTLGPHALLVTEQTRDDPARYRAALEGFAP